MKFQQVSVVSLSIILAACSSPKLSDSLYRDSEVGRSKQTVRCKVLEVREIKIRSDRGDNSGSLFGALIGGELGSRVGGGNGSILGSTVGVLGGSIAGEQLGDKMSERKGLEYSIITASGEERTFTQDYLKGDRIVKKGEDCRMQISFDGRNRVLPVRGFADAVKAPKTTKIIK